MLTLYENVNKMIEYNKSASEPFKAIDDRFHYFGVGIIGKIQDCFDINIDCSIIGRPTIHYLI